MNLARRNLVLGFVAFMVAPLCTTSARAEFGRTMTRREQEKLNQNSVGIVAGGPGGKYIELTADLATLLDDHNNLEMRVVGMIGKGSIQNIEDLLNLHRVDFAIVQNDVLDYLARQPGYQGIAENIGYVAKLYEEEIHILANGDVARLDQLSGRPVAIGAPGSGTRLTAETLFRILNIDVAATDEPAKSARARLVSGDIAAMVYVGGKSLTLFNDLSEADVGRHGLHFIGIPDEPMLSARYQPGELTREDYPNIVNQGETIRTMSVSAVMAVYWWPRNHPRYRSTARFVEAFFGRFKELANVGFAEKWRQVDLRAGVPGWRLYPPVSDWLAAHPNFSGTLDEGEEGCLDLFLGDMKAQGVDVDAISKGEYARTLARFAVAHSDICG